MKLPKVFILRSKIINNRFSLSDADIFSLSFFLVFLRSSIVSFK